MAIDINLDQYDRVEPEPFFGGRVITWASRRPNRDVLDVFVVRYSALVGGRRRTEALTPDGWVEYEEYAVIDPATSLSGASMVDHSRLDAIEERVTDILKRAVGTIEVQA